MKKSGPNQPTKDGIMIIFSAVNLKELFENERDYPWQKPENCTRCNSIRLWGHGFVQTIFDGFDLPLWLKRYRCPDCKCVLKIRPKGYLKRFQASIKTIRSSIEQKAKAGRWLSGISRTRQCHWFRALRRKICAYLGNTWGQGVLKGFDHLLAQGHVPVSCSI